MGLAGLVLLGLGLWQVSGGLYIKAKAVVAQVLLERAWDQTLATGEAVKPWPWADTRPLARIEVPRLGASAIVFADASGEAMAFGPGHMRNTPLPGARGTSIISAHRDTHFAFLENVKPGDTVTLTMADGLPRRFTVTTHQVVHADSSGIDPLAGDGRLALVTCWPFNGVTRGALRYVVFAQSVPEEGSAS